MHANNIKETTSTTGTGTLTLTSASGFARFSAAFPVGAITSYAIKTASGDWEWGLGTVAASNTLARTAVTATLVSGTYTSVGATALSLSGTSEVFCVEQAQSVAPTMPAVASDAGLRLVLPEGLHPSTNTRTLTANVPRASCLLWNCSATITHLACEVDTANGTGSDRIQMGVYACNPNGSIGALLMRSADVLPNSTGVKQGAIDGGSRRLPPGWYWWAVASSAGPALRAYNGGGASNATMSTPMGHAAGAIHLRLAGGPLTTLSGGWTALSSSTSIVSLAAITAEFQPTVGAIVA